MEIIKRKLTELKPNPRNPRKPAPNSVIELAESIKKNPQFFEARPILLSDRTGELVIIAGERRSEAAKYLGMKEVPTILISGLTLEQEDEIMIRDNTHNGVWDEQKLKEWSVNTLDSWKCPVTWDVGNRHIEDALPPELQGLDLNPSELPEMESQQDCKTQRVIITFLPENEPKIAKILGLNKIEKIVYRLEEDFGDDFLHSILQES